MVSSRRFSSTGLECRVQCTCRLPSPRHCCVRMSVRGRYGTCDRRPVILALHLSSNLHRVRGNSPSHHGFRVQCCDARITGDYMKGITCRHQSSVSSSVCNAMSMRCSPLRSYLCTGNSCQRRTPITTRAATISGLPVAPFSLVVSWGNRASTDCRHEPGCHAFLAGMQTRPEMVACSCVLVFFKLFFLSQTMDMIPMCLLQILCE